MKAGKAHFLHLLKTLPEVYRYHEQQEEMLRASLQKPATILREQRTFRSVKEAFAYLADFPHAQLYYQDPETKKFVPHRDEITSSARWMVKRYLTLRELRERAEEVARTEEGQDDWGGCGCFSDIAEDELQNVG